jgi:hypothetical protein
VRLQAEQEARRKFEEQARIAQEALEARFAQGQSAEGARRAPKGNGGSQGEAS